MMEANTPAPYPIRKARLGSKPKPLNPIDIALDLWIGQLTQKGSGLVHKALSDLNARAPKRWVVYFPLVLLPSGSFDEQWWESVKITDPEHRQQLWRTILQEIGKREGKGTLTHLAVNSGIPLHSSVDSRVLDNDTENILRTPSGLIMLHGNFGPNLDPKISPTKKDFENAFWVSTKQNGITQVWAPRYTMFSRGNIKEKTRLLNFYSSNKNPGSTLDRSNLKNQSVVDLYAGIGYFVFSYVKIGMKRVIGWELNPWSVEGLRRGALMNGWSVRIFRSGEALLLGDEQICIVLEDNKLAQRRLKELGLASISHINCGLLPSSQPSWETAVDVLNMDGWLHLHENVGVHDIESRREEIEDVLREILVRMNDKRCVEVEHVELVKTFAPGVWHCVFDVWIHQSRQASLLA